MNSINFKNSYKIPYKYGQTFAVISWWVCSFFDIGL